MGVTDTHDMLQVAVSPIDKLDHDTNVQELLQVGGPESSSRSLRSLTAAKIKCDERKVHRYPPSPPPPTSPLSTMRAAPRVPSEASLAAPSLPLPQVGLTTCCCENN